MPEYIKLCIDTWKQPYIILNYNNLSQYTDLQVNKLKDYSLPMIADCIRVHVLRDNGGYWLDTDTIMLENDLPIENIAGDVKLRTNTIGFLHTEPNSEMYKAWAAFQDNIINSDNKSKKWNLFGNAFTDEYIKNHREISIVEIKKFWPETYKLTGDSRKDNYIKLYFKENYNLSDFELDKLLMLHNSWTPSWYKNLSKDEVLNYNCTLSNILRELTK